MKIPANLQIFDHHVELTYADQDRLTPHLSGWNKLANTMLLDVPEKDLEKLLILELMGKQRRTIIDRLLAPLMRHKRRQIEARMEKVL